MNRIRSLFIVPAALLLAASSQAFWVRQDFKAPVDRLIKNQEAKVAKDPQDANAVYLLARLHSLAWAQRGQELTMNGTETEFSFPQFASIRAMRMVKSMPSREELAHLTASLKYYQKAVKLDKENSLYQFGRAWMMEQAAGSSDRIDYIKGITPVPNKPEEWLKAALKGYRKVYKKEKPKDLAMDMNMQGVADSFLSKQAGEAILRLAARSEVGSFKKGEKADIQATIAKIDDIPKAVTPIIFPVNGGSFRDLINPRARVGFDIAGDNTKRSWPWVTRNAAFLVWDPENSGRITSGRQLFGSATFWMFFRNGYEALASLDDNSDGWLKGRELSGIAVWQDKNENAISDPGEVTSVELWRIHSIRTTSKQTMGVMPWEKNGLVMNGRFVPTYDWIPTSL